MNITPETKMPAVVVEATGNVRAIESEFLSMAEAYEYAHTHLGFDRARVCGSEYHWRYGDGPDDVEPYECWFIEEIQGS
jgi:hypothetical protein